ncbi:hypothetical protein AUC68_12620 [Methyloceanibacter methanicus]|uniref:Uncharacterized protein n=1 Tax=Methyloceanibacter methanicus TaxID=1774968 RepID=A0A1E3W6S1_9HYPH|nr:hypothetical protein [Methyloceanibacter methanicus]ODS01202.1 hypothetical protein AUC68_12620 [Methyloceanibacter methanicus]
MSKNEISEDRAQPRSRAELLREFGFAWRRQCRGLAARSWRDTVTDFKPELARALAHEKARMPVRLRDLPGTSK